MNIHNLSYRYLILTLTLLLAAALFISCGSDKPVETTAPTETTTVATTVQTEPPIEYFKLTPQAVVVRPEGELSADMSTAIKMISAAGKAIAGDITITEDWYRDEMVRAELEILLGKTNRPESGERAELLTYYDYMYEVVSPGIVVICGGSDSATLKGVQKFLLDCYGYRAGQSGENKDVPVGTTYTYRHDYGLTLTLCGKPIEDFLIVHKDNKLHREAAESLGDEAGRDARAREDERADAEEVHAAAECGQKGDDHVQHEPARGRRSVCVRRAGEEVVR
jgi:hypothetical protein